MSEPDYTSGEQLEFRANNAMDQLVRYGSLANSDVVEALEALTDINDDLCNGRSDECVAQSVDGLRAVLDKISPPKPKEITPEAAQKLAESAAALSVSAERAAAAMRALGPALKQVDSPELKAGLRAKWSSWRCGPW